MMIASVVLPDHWLSWVVFYAIFAANVVLDLRLLTILYKKTVRKQLPWFVLYICSELLSTSVGLATWLINQEMYTIVYWWKEVLRVALLVAAVRESLLHIFKGFKSMLRWSVLGAILLVILYSAWKAVYAPPVESTRLGEFIIGAEFAFRWGIAGVAVLTVLLMRLIGEPRTGREYSVVMGCGIASAAFLAWVLSRSLFGTRFTFFTQYFPDVGYFVAVLWWIRVFQRPVQQFGFKELGMGPQAIWKELRRYRELAERIVGKRT